MLDRDYFEYKSKFIYLKALDKRVFILWVDTTHFITIMKGFKNLSAFILFI